MSHKPYAMERITACLTYLSAGWIGVVVLLIQTLCKKQPTHFVLYHVFQAIFLFFGYYILSTLCGLLVVIIARIPIINMIPHLLNASLPALGGLSFIQAIIYTVILYLAITSLAGRYSFLPWVSNIIIYWIKR